MKDERPSSAYGVPAIYRECVTDHKACGGAAKPENGTCNLLGATKPTNGHVFQHRVEGVSLSRHHLVEHPGVDDARTYRIDTNAPCGIVQGRAFGEPEHAVLGGLVCSTFGTGHQSSNRRAVDDGAISLLEHLAMLDLHAPHHTAQIDRNHAVKVFSGSIGCFHSNILDAGIVVGRIELPKRRYGLLNHAFYLSIVSDVAVDGKCVVPLRR